ncbi:hypothetical protein JG687_00003416 [Phytophthora cactorum]|uniref:Uncharacterized protein n=1 Tax=Phytophthora cactorum TaxID=29920 RepID=A0A8T1US54_9STRA|nr:hypothetical protein JG687_00003416 [Phytophthora cactorum]
MTFPPLLHPIVRMGDALLGKFARMFVLVLGFLSPSMSKSISWDYNPEDVGPIVPVSVGMGWAFSLREAPSSGICVKPLQRLNQSV